MHSEVLRQRVFVPRTGYACFLKGLLVLPVALMLLAMTNLAVAQQVPPRLPGSVEPGRREEAPPDVAPPPLDFERIFRLPPGAEPPADVADRAITIEDLRLEGVKVYEPEELRPLFAPIIGREVTVAELFAVARAIQARYQSDGYILSFAFIPPQSVEDGVFTITVVEGYVEQVLVEDQESRLQETLARVVEPITGSRPLHADDLERYLLLANDLAGMTVTGVLRPSETTPGAANLVVKSTHDPLDASLLLDNRGSEFQGRGEATASFTLNSLLGLGEAFSGRASVTRDSEELKSFSADYVHPFGSEGLRVHVGAAYALAEPGSTLESFDVETDSLTLGLDVTYPLIRRREESLFINAGFVLIDTAVDLLGSKFSRDRLRELVAGFTYLRNGILGGRSGASFRVIQGLPILNATDPDEDMTSRADSEPDFTKTTLDVQHLQPLFDRFALTVSARGQIAFQPLPAAEEFALGGARYGRAYNPGEITGENGIALSLELGYDLPVAALPLAGAFGDGVRFLFEGVRPYAFYDVGKAWDDKTSSSAGLNQSLASAGFGVRIELPYGLRAAVEYAHPLTRTPSNKTDGNSDTVFVFLSIGY